MVGDTFKETASIRDGVFYDYGVIPSLKSIFGMKKDQPIYEVVFEVVEVCPKYPDSQSKANEITYYALYDEDEKRYSLIQPTAEMFGMQFPYDVWKKQGTLKIEFDDGTKEYYGKVVRIKPKSHTEIKES